MGEILRTSKLGPKRATIPEAVRLSLFLSWWDPSQGLSSLPEGTTEGKSRAGPRTSGQAVGGQSQDRSASWGSPRGSAS